jgi:hypothetical protein
MKKTIYLLTLLSVAIIFSTSCEKQKKDPVIDNGEFYTYSTTAGAAKILKFENESDFDLKLSQLSMEIELRDSLWLNSNASLSDDQLDSLEEFSLYQFEEPLDSFDTHYQFSSLRSLYNTDLSQWLDNYELDTNIRLTEKYFGLSTVELTLFNEDGAVVIGTDIMLLTENGLIAFPDLNWEAYLTYLNGGLVPEVTDVYKTTSMCTMWKGSDRFIKDPVNGKWMVQEHVHFHKYPWKAVSGARLNSFKERKNGKWKRARITMGISSQNNFVDKDDCQTLTKQFWMYTKVKKRSSFTRYGATYGSFEPHRARKNYSVLGEFSFHGLYRTLALTW